MGDALSHVKLQKSELSIGSYEPVGFISTTFEPKFLFFSGTSIPEILSRKDFQQSLIRASTMNRWPGQISYYYTTKEVRESANQIALLRANIFLGLVQVLSQMIP